MNTMSVIVASTLTILATCAILIVISKKNKKYFKKTVYRQSDMHNLLKKFFDIEISNKKSFSSQLRNREDKQTTKVIILDDNAYWVVDNIFYVGKAVNGEARPETGIPIDTSKLSTTDINKLLFILDALKGGKSNDSGSTRNE